MKKKTDAAAATKIQRLKPTTATTTTTATDAERGGNPRFRDLPCAFEPGERDVFWSATAAQPPQPQPLVAENKKLKEELAEKEEEVSLINSEEMENEEEIAKLKGENEKLREENKELKAAILAAAGWPAWGEGGKMPLAAAASAETCEERDKAVPNQGGGNGWVECTCAAHPGHCCSDHSPSNECFIDPGCPDCACCDPSEDPDEDDHGRLTQTDGTNHQDAEEDVQCNAQTDNGTFTVLGFPIPFGMNHQDAEEDVECHCFKCETEWTCQVEGGDWGVNEGWVCEKCLPTCRGCEKKLFERDDERCGSGRTDDDEDDASAEEEMMETERDMRSRRNCLDLIPLREDFKKPCKQEGSDHEVVAFTHDKIQKRCYALELQMVRDDFKRFRKNKMISFPKTAKEFTLQGETWFYMCASRQTECENSPEVLGMVMQEDGRAWVTQGYGYVFRSKTNAQRLVAYLNEGRAHPILAAQGDATAATGGDATAATGGDATAATATEDDDDDTLSQRLRTLGTLTNVGDDATLSQRLQLPEDDACWGNNKCERDEFVVAQFVANVKNASKIWKKKKMRTMPLLPLSSLRALPSPQGVFFFKKTNNEDLTEKQETKKKQINDHDSNVNVNAWLNHDGLGERH